MTKNSTEIHLILIQKILNSSQEQRLKILRSNSGLIDIKLASLMRLVADEISETEDANSLTELADLLEHSVTEWRQINRQVIELYECGEYSTAVNKAEESLILANNIWGKEHKFVSISLHHLGLAYFAQGRYVDSEKMYLQALDMTKKILGEDHIDVATSLNNLANLYSAQGRYVDSEKMYLQALGMTKKILGEDHIDIATSLNNLANLYSAQGRYAESEKMYLQALDTTKKMLGEDCTEVSRILNNLALVYSSQGKYLESEKMYLKALDIQKHLFGEEHPEIVKYLSNLGLLYMYRGSYIKAELLFQKTLKIRKYLLGAKHPDVSQSLNNLALIYFEQGKYSESEQAYLQALEMRKCLLGEQHPEVATVLHNLASVYFAEGRYWETEQAYLQALEMRKRFLGEQHPEVARSLNNLALFYKQQKRYEEAEQIYKQALSIRQKCLGEKHPEVAHSLNNCSTLYRSQGRYVESEPLLLKALEIIRSQLGEDHPEVAKMMSNMAIFHHSRGSYTKAKSFYEQAIDKMRTSLGKDHPEVGNRLKDLGSLCAATTHSNKSLSYMIQAVEIDDKMLNNIFSFSSEDDRFSFIKKIRVDLDVFLSLAYKGFPYNSRPVKVAYDLVLKRKAITTSALAAQNEALCSGRYPSLTEDFHKLRDLSEQIIHLTFSTPQIADFTIYREQLSQLQAEYNSLQKKLASQVPEIQLQEQFPSCSDVILELPVGSTLIEFVHFDICDFKAIPSKGEAQWKPARYLAFILHAGQPESVEMIDIGEAEYIDNLIREFRKLVSGAGKNAENQLGMFSNLSPQLVFREYHPQVGIKLRQAIFDKLRPYLQEYKHLIIAPDGELNLVPFQILPNNDTGEKKLIDEFTISYLTVGRDIMRQKVETKRPASLNALVFASPNFDLSAESITSDAAQRQNTQTDNLRESIANNPLKPAVGTNILGKRIAQRLKVESLCGK
jgi:tetratricopeptide (TPR) repeat protein